MKGKELNLKAYTYQQAMAYKVELSETKFRNNKSEIVLQNKYLGLNARITDAVFEKIMKNSKGIENIDKTFEQPHEVWGVWENAKQQTKAIFNFITFGGNGAYIVQLSDGYIINAYALTNAKLIDSHRKGCLL